jgi:hypothetical protein
MSKSDLHVVGSTQPEPPYGQVKAKGLQFKLDYERINQSDTWALAPPEIRPWLLMMWFVSWQQVPAGSFSDDEKAICARIGMPWTMWQHHRDVLMRGWYLASDGRLYHRVIGEFVREVEEWRQAEAERKAEFRKKQRDTGNVPRDPHGTPVGVRTPEPEPDPEPKPDLSKPLTAGRTTGGYVPQAGRSPEKDGEQE